MITPGFPIVRNVPEIASPAVLKALSGGSDSTNPTRVELVSSQHGRRQLVLGGLVVSADQLPHVIVIQRLPASVVAVFLDGVAKQRTDVVELHHPT